MRSDDSPKSSPKSSQSLDCPQSRSSRETPDTAEIAPSSGNTMFTSGDFLMDDTVDRDDDGIKHDNRLSRRKADRPRKRKRESTDSPVHLHTADVTADSDIHRQNSAVADRINVSTVDKADDCVLNLSSGNQSVPNSPGPEETILHSQQLPEDLSLVHKSSTSTSKGDKGHIKAAGNVISSSVHELEKAMSRHLPSRSKSHYQPTQSRSPSDQHWTVPFSFPSTLPYNVPFCSNSPHSNRQSVIRSNLAGRGVGINGDIQAGILGPHSSDLALSKDQILHIPQITPHTKHHFHSQKDILQVSDEYGMTPPSSVSPNEKTTPGYPDTDINPDCLGMRSAHRQTLNTPGKCHFQGISDAASDMAKQHYLSVPSYPFHNPDLGVFTHPSQAASSILLENRQPSNTSVWYGTSHPT